MPMQRVLSVISPAIPKVGGVAALEPIKLTGREAINELFCYELTLQTQEALAFTGVGANFDTEAWVGKEISMYIELDGSGTFIPGLPGGSRPGAGAGTREINGLIEAALYLGEDNRHHLYRLEIRPWLICATRDTDSRIWQNLTVIEVLREVLDAYPFSMTTMLAEQYPVRDYVTQFNETNFEFVTRLLQEYGINYFFTHSAGTHRLVLCDFNGAYKRFQATDQQGAGAYDSVAYYPPGHKIDQEYISSFVTQRKSTPGQYSTREQDYTRPRSLLAVTQSDPQKIGHANGEIYLWRTMKPGLGGSDYHQPNAGADRQANQTEPQGQMLARVRMQMLRQYGNRAKGHGNIRGLVPACTFVLQNHPNQKANEEYILLACDLTLENIAEATQRNEAKPSDSLMLAEWGVRALTDAQCLTGQWQVSTQFEVQPSREILRPDITRSKPTLHGPETGIVCGSTSGAAASNIYTDQYGRIKVQLRFMRNSSSDQNASCWIRVASPWAGSGQGIISVPRVGQEVVVSFLGGDLDCPLVTGSVANELNLPSWQLPVNQHLYGWRSRECVSQGGNSANGRSNFIVTDDTPGAIQAQVHSEHQFSQLSLGYITRIEKNHGRKDFRGQGYELRTDGHGALRANWGLLLSTYGRAAAQDHILSLNETGEQLDQAQVQHANMGKLAQHHLAQENGDMDAVDAALKTQNEQIKGLSRSKTSPQNQSQTDSPGQQNLQELNKPHIILTTPANLVGNAGGSTHLQSGEHMAVTAGKHISLAASESLLVSVGKHLRALANYGIRLIAAKEAVLIQAQNNDVNVQAAKQIRINGKTGTLIEDAQFIHLQSGPHAIHIDSAGGISIISPQAPKFLTSSFSVTSAQSVSQVVQNFPQSQFNDPYVLRNPLGEPIKNAKVRVIRADGSSFDTVSDGQGKLPIEKGLSPDRLRIHLL